ncbi:MAG: Inner membrane protein YqjF [Sodalis sp.]|nr:MAG: Inner membrane protein YqjF [Sodalis sp.]
MAAPGLLLLTICLKSAAVWRFCSAYLTCSVSLITVIFTLLTAFLFHADFTQAGNQINFMKNLPISDGLFAAG